MKRSLKIPARLNWFPVPCSLAVVLILLLLSRGSVTISGQDLEGESGLDLEMSVTEAELLPNPPAPLRETRWYRSNAGGMALQEAASRIAAMGNEYALLIDFPAAKDIPRMLSPYYRNGYIIEIHVLYHNGAESRKQWIFRDAKGIARLVSVLNEERKQPEPAASAEGSGSSGEAAVRVPWGFIEIYNENYRITEELMFSDDGGESRIDYSYRGGLLIKAEGWQKDAVPEDAVFRKIYTDDYRYNRSSSLRSVERLFHEDAEAVPIRFSFPNRVLDMAKETNFIEEKPALNFEFFGDYDVKTGYRMVFTTDDRGRILTQTLLDKEDNPVWIIQNNWTGNRLASALKTEGEDVSLIEYEYDDGGDRIIERNIRNGVLERLVRSEGGRDVEELYMQGQVILRAIWEDGRKISEERIRRNR